VLVQVPWIPQISGPNQDLRTSAQPWVDRSTTIGDIDLTRRYLIGSVGTHRTLRSRQASGSRDFGSRSREPITFCVHAGVGVEQFQLAVGDQVADDERALPYSPESFSALKIGQFASLGRREAQDVGSVWGLG
jgi:hypothetical protein